MTEYEKLIIGGRWETPANGERLHITSPATLEPSGSCPAANKADVDRAVAVAREALESGPWPKTAPEDRAAVLAELRRLLTERAAEFTALISAETGAPHGVISTMQHLPSDSVLEYYSGAAGEFDWESERTGRFGRTLVRREPVGVVAAITAWNVPLFLAINKLAPALLAGCPVILKPAPETPLDALALGALCAEAGLPEGVLSVLPAATEASAYLAAHPGVDKVSFTGSTAVGKEIARGCADRMARVSLELGGKSAAIVLEDADIPSIAPMIAFSGLMNSGQACVAQSRILAPRSRRAELVEALAAAANAMAIGDPEDPGTQLGPLISERQRERVESYLAAGRAEGARLVTGGNRPERPGWYLEPAVFDEADNAMRIAREEIFGPVLTVLDYETETEAVAIANDSDYGLAGSVWTNDVEHGVDIARAVRTGTYGINWYAFDSCAPFGGYKQSGIGREGGPEGLAAFCESKSILMPPGS
ncbi:aldehyde dehydrogenase [Sciscionella marina]|uniref:aldehyde dehydrogenase n=1 Tax=Sciscionella marina TaxID=508770 RepID=UPI000378CEB3|nr:aldehyde dehydrogenase [Sciscionella marina]